ncbi:MAG: acetyl-CoA carboxylase biotin carboxylase subunit [bacterium]|jgi:acetyl-CoA carboxylase biotin carboxylase subunit
MYKKILIANRGEIALRIIRACREMGIRTVTVHSTADSESLHVKLADESMCIGEAPSSSSYLHIPSIISVAEITGVEAIHPGYGFLSEDADFVEKCNASNIDFIGPSAEAIRLMGDKISGRNLAEKAGVAVTPGAKDAISSVVEAKKIAAEIGFPVMIKASAGGGGRGLRIVHSKGGLAKAFEVSKAEAGTCFNNETVFIEKYIEKPRHIEVQLIGDKHGNIIHLGTRDCSIQRRNQKIIEEAPATNVPQEIIDAMCQAAVKVAKQVNYFSAGTIEFLMDHNHNFYFMEMNTRLQVEHPVTEMITRVDLVKEQIRVAAGEKLSITQEKVILKGHSIECRINAEDPEKFTPSPGKITAYHSPGGFGIRVDSAAYHGAVISPYYDSMIAKLITHGKTREEAIQKMLMALDEYTIEGIKTSIPLQRRIMRSLRYKEGNLSTDFLKNFINF